MKPSKRSFRILLVEDNKMNQMVMTKLLLHLNITADVAANGKLGVERVLEKEYDIVFMDTQMPEMDGLEATRVIRSNENIKQPFIVSITASAMRSEIDACLQAGMDSYLCKPITLQALKTLLKEREHCLYL
ncbi:MAG: response regulator [Cytophagales bacterium]|nr:response regulator [Cytophagales bacterium]